MNGKTFRQKQEERNKGLSVRKWLCSTSIIVLVGAMSPGMVMAQEWTGSVSNDWANAANWQGGSVPASNGNVEINNEGAGWPLINGTNQSANSVRIGSAASGGGLTISGGGILNLSGFADIGINHAGSAIVTGTGSIWNIGQYLELGYTGAGTITIQNNGQVHSKDGYLGHQAVGSGTANVANGGAWTNDRNLFVGYGGTGTLNISSGGAVAANDKTYVGFWGTASSAPVSTGAITIDGSGSLLTTGGFVVGREGQGTVSVTNGGAIESASGIIGEQAGSTGTVDLRSGAFWHVDTAVTIGAAGTGSLLIDGGAKVESQIATVGRNVGGTGTVTVSGNGSNWTNTGDFTIARDGTGTMTVTGDGATVNSGRLGIGNTASADGTLTLSHDGRWTSTQDALVGAGGTGKVRIESGGWLTTVGGQVGTAAGSNGTVEINSAAASNKISTWDATTGDITVGGAGGTGKISISEGGNLEATNLLLAASGGGAATVELTTRGTALTTNTAIGTDAGTSGIVTVSGDQTTLAASSFLHVGLNGQGTLLLDNKGKVTAANVFIARGPSATGSVTVSNEGLLTATNLRVGDLGNGTLTVKSGGAVFSAGGRIAQDTGSTGTVLVTGSTSQWNAEGGALHVGDNGNASLTVTDGAMLRGDAINVGSVTGSATLTASNGATVLSDNFTIGYGTGRIGSATITGAGTNWTANGGVFVGLQANGALTIADGAKLKSADSSIGGLAGTSGNVLVTGANSVWDLGAGVISVGGVGPGTLAVENGGRVIGDIDVLGGGTLRGNGIVGNTGIHSGGTLVGVQGRTLSINGDLALYTGANVNVALGTPGNAGALFNVYGNLRLDGTLNVTNAGGFGAGVYRIMGYSGSLTDNGLIVGTMPSGTTGTVQTAVANEVNLLVSGMANDTQFWNGATTTADGVIHGGNGTWRVGPTNWTDANGTATESWGSQFAVFQNNPGIVTVDNSAGAITTTGMQFIGSTWEVGGDAIALNGTGGSTTIRVGDGTAAGASHVAVIGSALTGASRLVKDDLGTLLLTGTNTYSGGTTINAGVLEIGRDGTSGSILGDVANNALLRFSRTDATTFSGLISGSGEVHVARGSLTLTGNNTYGGLTKISTGASLTLGGGGTSGTIVGDVSNSGTLSFNRSNAYGFGGVISGTGAIRQIGGGTTTLTGNSSAFTGTTSVESGTLAVNGQLGGTLSVQSGGTLTGTGTVGAVSVANGGVLAGTQGQTLNTGNLTLASGANVNVSLGTPGNASGLFNVGGNLTLDGTLNVSDAGGFGQGVYRIFDYSGSLTDNGMNVGTMPSGTGTIQTAMANQVNLVVDNGGPIPTTQFWNGTTTTADGTIHGGNGTWSAGSATNWTNAAGSASAAWGGNFAVFQSNPGTVTVDNAAGAVSTTGMQFMGAGWNVAGAAITLNGAGGNTTVRVGDGTVASASDSATIGSVLTGNSRLVKDDYGTLILTGANSYTGGTTIAGGTLQIGDVGTSGSITGDVLNNGLLRFSRTDATSFGGLISGSGAVHVAHGQLTLTGNNTYAGETTIGSIASLTLGDGGTTGSVAGNIVNNGLLQFNRSNDLTYAGVISGYGAVRQIGSGKTELTGNSSAFTGTTTVQNGILAVNGQLGGTLDVLSGGRLQGTGTVGNTIVSGVIAPGNSIGTLNVGNITFNAGSIYEVEVNAAGQTDLIKASGTATITGGSVQVLAGSGNYAPQTQYTILTATGGRTGNFAGVTSNLAFLDPSLSYDANNVYLTMTRNDISFQNVGVTPNQIATGGGVESLGFGNPVYDAVLNLSAPQAQGAFDMLSGEIHASAKTAMLEDSRFLRTAINDRIRAAFDGVGASNGNVVTYDNGKPRTVAANTDGGAVWGHAFGAWGHWNGDGNAARLDRSIGGFFVGADAPAFDTWRFGAVAGYSRTSFDAKDRHSTGTSDNYHVGLYGGTTWGDLAFRTGAAYTLHDISTNRSIIFPGFGNSLTGDYKAGTAQVFGELGYKMQAGNVALEPFANLAYVNLHTDGLTEKGGAAALTSGSSSTDATFTTLGLRAASSFNLGETAVTAKGMLGWRHAFGDVTPDSVMRFAGGGNSFTIGGVPIARNAAVVEAGLDFALSPTATLGVSYGGQFGSGVVDQSVRANFNVKF